MKEFFENLKEIRINKKIELEDIAKRTRLSITKLQDIEAGNLGNFTKGYDRIFFKRYLKEIGEDKKEVWEDFNLFFGTEAIATYDAIQNEKKSDLKAEPSQMTDDINQDDEPTFWQEMLLKLNMDKIHKYFWIAITVIVLGIVGFFTYQQFVFVKKNHAPIKEITVADYIDRMQQEDSLSTPPQRNASLGYSDLNNKLNVELRALQRTWIREICDESDTTDYILPLGLTKKIAANHTVNLMLGRADGVEIWLNGENLGVMGNLGEIVPQLILKKNGITEKRVRKSVKKQTTTRENTSQSSQNIEQTNRSNINNRVEL